MDGKQSFVLGSVTIIVMCLTVIYSFLFISLWPYREWVGGSLIVALLLWAGTHMRGKLNEQDLRWTRIRHHEEIPLDKRGEPHYLPQGAQANPHRRCVPVHDQQQGEE